MGKKKVKYHIIEKEVIKNLVEFIDDIQLRAINNGADKNYQTIDLCNYFISHLINSDSFTDTFNTDLPRNDRDLPPEAFEMNDRFTRRDIIDLDSSDISDEEYEMMLSQLDGFIKGWKKTYHESNSKIGKSKKVNLKRYSKELKSDKDLSPTEQFDLYYEEHKKQEKSKDSKPLKSILDNLGLRLNSGGSDEI